MAKALRVPDGLLRANPALAARHGPMPWQVMDTMRHRVSHGDDQADLAIVWKTMQGGLPGLPGLRAQIAQALDTML